MELLHAKTERSVIKISLGILLGLILFIVLCWGGCQTYTHWEQRHLVRRAVGFLAGNNLKEAALCARRALQIGPSAGACRIMAQVAELTNDRSAIVWREKVLELQANSIDDQIALALTALQFDDRTRAQRSLETIPEGARDVARFRSAAARLAEAQKDQARALREWQRAVELEPTSDEYRLRYSLCRLREEDPISREAARADLLKLRGNEKQRVAATRALIADAAAHNESPQDIYRLAKELKDYPESRFEDRLLFLDLLRQMEHADYTRFLSQMEESALSSPNDLAALISWMNAHGLVVLAVDYSRSLVPKELNKWPVPLALAESYGRVGDWSDLERLTRSAQWGTYNFLRLAYLTRADRAQSKAVAAEHDWAATKKEAASDPETLWNLTKVISDWNWKSDVVDLLWDLTKFPDKEKEALQTLQQFYARELDSQGLYKATRALAELDPADVKLQNNLAQICLLLGIDNERARKTAFEVFQKDPTNPAFVSTYAFALLKKGDARGAVKVMSSLSEAQLRDPVISAYFGFCLAAAKDERARQYLESGRTAALLPEERALLEKSL